MRNDRGGISINENAMCEQLLLIAEHIQAGRAQFTDFRELFLKHVATIGNIQHLYDGYNLCYEVYKEVIEKYYAEKEE